MKLLFFYFALALFSHLMFLARGEYPRLRPMSASTDVIGAVISAAALIYLYGKAFGA